MSKEIYISSTPHETRLAIVENDALTEIYYERENEYTLAGSIYNGKVTRVLPGMQSSFVDIGLERDAFLYITDFMEEAGDSADFETNGDGNREPRRDNRDRGDRSGNRDTERAALPSPEATPSEDADRNSRGDRNGRGRGRRDRGRSGNRDRQPGTSQPVSFNDAPPSDFSRHAPPSIPASDQAEAGELGEGAPGADGTRRWRGRRGRRRGRGPGQRDESPNSIPAGQTEAAPASHDSYDEERSYDIDGAASPVDSPDQSIQDAGQPDNAAETGAQETGGRPDRNDRGYRDRNDRNDRGNRGGRDRDRGGRDQRSSRVPRGFAPRTSLYGVDNTPAQDNNTIEPAGEPIILPGESLSKYRPADQQTSAPRPVETILTPLPASDFIIDPGWDGGAVLPGETLRRHRPDSRSDRAEQRYDSRASSRNEVAPQPAAPAIEPEPAVVESAPQAPVITDYEPIEASASYRIDPVAPSEFRQSAPPVIEAEPEPQAESAESTSPIFEDHHEAVFTASHSITPAPEEHVEHLHEEVVELPAHDVTTVAPTGEMLSAPHTIEPSTSPANSETEPIAHEHSILSQPDLIAEEINSSGLTYVQPTFLPDEDTSEEEDFPATLHASSIEEMEDFDEEETLEGAADLGTMIREMSIDQITSPGDDLDEEDDLEEEDSVHDFDETEEEEDEEEDSEPVYADDEQAEEDFNREGALAEPAGEILENGAAAPRESSYNTDRRPRRDSGRRDGRRGGRDRGDRPRNTGGGGDRERSGGRRDGRSGHSSMQSTNLPAISDLLKPGQEVLVQIAKEPIARKGARITSHIALPGRFLVFMPTVNHTGVSRKIDSDTERRRLKEILLSEKGDAAGGFIVRTAAEGASEEELRSDLRFLLNLWADIKQRSESSKSPALIYHDLNLVERILRDQVTDNFSAIWVDTEVDYERILRFLQRFQPSLIRRVKLYTKETPLFEQFGITEEINKALRSKVWLKSGGSIVINQTEALVAIDINTGKFVGKTARLEDTIVKTNLDAIPEIVRQIRLRDLGGIIIIDFIDMDERKNRNRVMAALEEELKSDRAPSKVLQFNDFGLVAITRKRVKQSLERTLSTTCNVCTGTGMVKSPVTVCNDIYIEMRKMQKHLDRGDVMLRVNPEVVKQLKSTTSRWLQEMEEMVGKTILVKSDPTLHPEQFDIH
jgi:ribonuclease E